MGSMTPRPRSNHPRARVAAVATVVAFLAFSIAAVPLPQVPGALRPQAAAAAVSTAYVSAGRAPVAPGVVHDWGTIETTRSGTQAVNLVEVAIGTPGIGLETSLAGDRITRLETTTSMALRASTDGHRAVAAINGDVWGGYSSPTQYAPNGIDIHAGELVTAAQTARPTFGIDASGHPLIGNVLETVWVTWPDGTKHLVEHVNQARADAQFALYTPRFGPTTAGDLDGTDIVLAGVTLPLAPTGTQAAVVREVRPATGGIPIEPDTVVLNGPAGTPLDALKPGDPLPFTLSITPGWENVREAIGGREFIVRDGVESISPHPPIADQLHPRTALGITAAGGLVLATVDGRQSGYSAGVDLDELATLMLSRGVVQALNMDGGGSTTMDVRQPGDVDVSLANRPSAGREVSVANSLIVFSSIPTGPLATLDVAPAAPSLWVGEAMGVTVKGQDAALNGIALGPGDVAWTRERARHDLACGAVLGDGARHRDRRRGGGRGPGDSHNHRPPRHVPARRPRPDDHARGVDDDARVDRPGRNHVAGGDGRRPRRQGIPAAAGGRVLVGERPARERDRHERHRDARSRARPSPARSGDGSRRQHRRMGDGPGLPPERSAGDVVRHRPQGRVVHQALGRLRRRARDRCVGGWRERRDHLHRPADRLGDDRRPHARRRRGSTSTVRTNARSTWAARRPPRA